MYDYIHIRQEKKMKRKKITMLMLAVSMCTAFLAGCEKEKWNNSGSDEAGMGQENLKSEEMTTSSSEMYTDFLNDEVQLFFHKYNEYDARGVESYFDKERGYTLSEIVDVLCAHYFEYTGKTDVGAIKYAYMDCGNDGVQEMAVCFTGMDIYCEDDDSTLVYIIKEIDDQLELCYCYETWARSSASINEYGYYVSSGSGGASLHGTEFGYIDENGDWNYIAYIEEQSDISALSYPEELSQIPTVAASKSYEGTIVFLTYRFTEYTDADYYAGVEMDDDLYTFEVYDDDYNEISDESTYIDSVYKDIFDEAGVLIFSKDEMEEMLSERKDAVGVTDEIAEGKELEWKSI